MLFCRLSRACKPLSTIPGTWHIDSVNSLLLLQVLLVSKNTPDDLTELLELFPEHHKGQGQFIDDF